MKQKKFCMDGNAVPGIYAAKTSKEFFGIFYPDGAKLFKKEFDIIIRSRGWSKKNGRYKEWELERYSRQSRIQFISVE